ncbi:MAG: hypothetical protein DHS20C07_31550 [Methyloligella sp.]|nr:MAG: hypothetical protein DHS20C07_31550 [Methyloligella sp.]
MGYIAEFQTLLNAFANNKLNPVIGGGYRLLQYIVTFNLLQDPKRIRKIILDLRSEFN